MLYESYITYGFSSKAANFKAHGNPALIIFGNPTEEEIKIICKESKIDLNGVTIQFPIIDIIEPINIEKNIFSIKYYFPTGNEVNICGHGTICATRAIIERYKKEGKMETYTFQLNKKFEENKIQPEIKVESDGETFKITFLDVDLIDFSKKEKINKYLNENIPEFSGICSYGTLKDIICFSNNSKKLRETNFTSEQMEKLRRICPEFRLLIVIAKSEIKGFDYETSIISDQLPKPFYKDPACGSANKEVIKFLKINNLFPEKFINDIAKFKMFYPYRYSETGIMGGIQNVEAEWKKGIVNIICEASLGAKLNLKIENNKLIIV